MTQASPSPIGRFPLRFLQAAVAIIMALKVIGGSSIGTISWEPYYFLWDQHLTALILDVGGTE